MLGNVSHVIEVVFHVSHLFQTGFRKSISGVSQSGGILVSPIPAVVGGNGRLYGITAVRDQCPRGKFCSVNQLFRQSNEEKCIALLSSYSRTPVFDQLKSQSKVGINEEWQLVRSCQLQSKFT